MRGTSHVKQTERVPTTTHPRRNPAAIVTVASLGLVLTVLAATAVRRHLGERVPYATWTIGESTMWFLAGFSCVALVVAGPWLSWRLPTNRTGPCLTVAGFALAASIYGSYTPVPASPWAEQLLPTVYIAAVFIAVSSWPTGRMPARWSRPFGWAVAAYVIVGVGSKFVFAHSLPTDAPWWPTHLWGLPTLADAATSALGRNVVAVLLHGVAPILFLAFVVRRRASMPPSVRATSGPAFVAAALFGISELWAFTSTMAAAPLGGYGGRSTIIGMVGASVEFGRYGAVALLLVWSESMRRRSRASHRSGTHSVELGPAETGVDLSDEVASILGDPSALVVIRGADTLRLVGGEAKAPLAQSSTGRALITIADRDGVVVAAVEHDAHLVASSVTRDAMMTSIGMAVLRRARQVEADRRTAEVRIVQRRVLDSQDRTRRRLERNLHDGVQQRLVALALEASMMARRETAGTLDPNERDRLQAAVVDAIDFSHEVLSEGVPGVLDPGLSAGLVALDAAIPLTTRLDLRGDLPAEDPVAAALWFVASEAVANSLKHADAHEIRIHLRVDPTSAELTITDDGCGGAIGSPAAIARRLAAFDSTLEVTSPPGGGTTIRATIPLAKSRGAA